MPPTLRTLALAALWAFPADSLAAPMSPKGRYGSALGVLELRTDDGWVQGRLVEPGACGLEPERRVLEGDLEGDVLVGTVTVCQSGGPSCTEKAFPFLGFVDPKTQRITGTVRLDDGCRSEGVLEGGRLRLEPLTGEAAKPAPSELAQRRGRMKRNARQAERAFELGQKLLQDGAFAAASQQFLRALSLDDGHWPASLALGVSEFKLGHVQNALRAYERSRRLKPDFADTYYNIACVHARLGDRRLALENLRRAVLRFGFSEPEFMSSDPDLIRLLDADPEFKELIRKAQEQKARPPRPSRRGRSGKP